MLGGGNESPRPEPKSQTRSANEGGEKCVPGGLLAHSPSEKSHLGEGLRINLARREEK